MRCPCITIYWKTVSWLFAFAWVKKCFLYIFTLFTVRTIKKVLEGFLWIHIEKKIQILSSLHFAAVTQAKALRVLVKRNFSCMFTCSQFYVLNGASLFTVVWCPSGFLLLGSKFWWLTENTLPFMGAEISMESVLKWQTKKDDLCLFVCFFCLPWISWCRAHTLTYLRGAAAPVDLVSLFVNFVCNV